MTTSHFNPSVSARERTNNKSQPSEDSPIKGMSDIDVALAALDPVNSDIYGSYPEWPPEPKSRHESTKESVNADLFALAPASRRIYQENQNAGYHSIFSTRNFSCSSTKETSTGSQSLPVATNTLQHNLRCWRSVVRDECIFLVQDLPFFSSQLEDIVHLIDHYCV